ncbi:hypothetical protein F5B20DRAFT_596365 [Whalleya microplaca]|nr:hypothetical protein F5B20DRAFT_596365 [Whalleya microplaca]
MAGEIDLELDSFSIDSWLPSSSSSDDDVVPWEPKPRTGPPLGKLPIPMELDLMLLEHMDIPSLLQLRKTCSTYYGIITNKEIERLFTDEDGKPMPELERCCSQCLALPAGGFTVLDEEFRDPRVPAESQWVSLCQRCWRIKRNDEYAERGGFPIAFRNGEYGEACNVCGWPLFTDRDIPFAWAKHPTCMQIKEKNSFAWIFLLGVQIVLALLATPFAWTVFMENVMVVSAVTAGIALKSVYVCLVLSWKISYFERFHLLTLMEFTSFGVWLFSTWAGINQKVNVDPSLHSDDVVTLILLVFNTFVCIINTLGFALLWSGYDPRNPWYPGVSKWQKYRYVVYTSIVFWVHVW